MSTKFLAHENSSAQKLLEAYEDVFRQRAEFVQQNEGVINRLSDLDSQLANIQAQLKELLHAKPPTSSSVVAKTPLFTASVSIQKVKPHYDPSKLPPELLLPETVEAVKWDAVSTAARLLLKERAQATLDAATVLPDPKTPAVKIERNKLPPQPDYSPPPWPRLGGFSFAGPQRALESVR